MADKKFDFPLLLTPFGEAEWAYLTKPDTKFNELGDYKVNLIVSAEEAAPFLESVKGVLDKAVAEETEKAEASAKNGRKPKAVKVTEFLPWEELEDGRILLKLKRKAKVITKEGETKEFTVPLVDGSGTTIPLDQAAGLNIGNGSIIRARAEIVPYASPTQGVGVSFRLKDAQIRKLVAFQSNSGFGAVEDEDAYTFQASQPGESYAAAGGDDEGVSYTV